MTIATNVHKSQIQILSAPLRLCASALKKNPVEDGVTENRWYRVAVTNGVIYSIYDKELARDLIDGPANRFMYTRNNHKTWEAEPEKALGAEMSPDFDHYELWRDGKFLANVKNEVPNGIPYRVARYEDKGLPTHSRHEYRIRKVWKDGRKDPLGEPFYGLTR